MTQSKQHKAARRTQLDNTAPRQAGIYLVAASDDQSSGDTLEAQRRQTTGMAQAKGWQIVREYRDVDKARPERARMLHDAAKGEINAVIVSSFDRLGESIGVVLEVIERLDNLGVAFVACQESFDTTTPIGQLMLPMFSALADIERKHTVQRSPKQPTTKQASGVDRGGKIPYGYRRIYDEATGDLIDIGIAEQQSQIVRRIFALRDQGLTLEAIANDLRPRGISPLGKGWTPTAVHRILKNKPKYEGGPGGLAGKPWPAILEVKNHEHH